jgi:hypothetical protein
MINTFGSSLLDEIHWHFSSEQKTELDSKCESILRNMIKQARKQSRDNATKFLQAELATNKTLNENLGFIILECLKRLPTAKIKNDPSETTLITNYLDHVLNEAFHSPDKHMAAWPSR